MITTQLLLAPPPRPLLPIFSPKPSLPPITTSVKSPTIHLPITKPIISSRRDFRAWADDGDGDSGSPDDYDMDDEEAEEVDNKKDFDVDYDTTTAISATAAGGEDDILIVQSKSFISTQGWDSEKIVEYRINEEEFHKICLLDCDFFIRKPPDPDDDVYDFREVQVKDHGGSQGGHLDPQHKISGLVTEKTDVYSFGVLMLALFTGETDAMKHREGTRERIHIRDYVKDFLVTHQVKEIADPRMLEDEGNNKDEMEQQLLDFLDLALRCTEYEGMNRPVMIDVAKELRQMEKSVRNT